MGGSTKQTTNTKQTTEPWSVAQPALRGILGGVGGINPWLNPEQTGAINSMTGIAQQGNPFFQGISNFAQEALGGGGNYSPLLSGAYEALQRGLGPTAGGNFLDPQSNPFFAATTQALGNDVQNRLSAMYAGAGRDPAGAGSFPGALARGISEATAPLYAGAYDTERNRQLGAMNTLFGAGAQTAGGLSGLDTSRFANMGQGIAAAQAATEAQIDPYRRILEAEAMRQGIPLGIFQNLASIVNPIASLGGTTQGTSTSRTQHPWWQPVAAIGQAFGGGRGGGGGGGGGG